MVGRNTPLVAMAVVGSLLVGTPSAHAQDVEANDHVVVILDGSGSMKRDMGARTRMDAAKEALSVVLRDLDPQTHIGIYAFSARVRDPWVYPLGPRDDARLAEAIAAVQPSGETPLGRSLKDATDALFEVREKEFGYGTYRLLVVTDGEATDEKLMLRYAPELVNRGIGMDVIGVAMQEDHALKRYGHSYRSADDPETLVMAVREALAEVPLGDEASAEVFAELEGLPDAFSMAAIEALAGASQANHPLGERPKPKVEPAPAAPPRKDAPVPERRPAPSACSSLPATTGLGLFGVLLLGLRRRQTA